MMQADTSEAERRAEILQNKREQTGIDEQMIGRLVRGFYARIREDELLGPIFETRITDWEPHLRRMCAFWSSIVLASGLYHGQPMRMHLPLPVDARHFDRWLALFEATARDLCPTTVADHFLERATDRPEPRARYRKQPWRAARQGRAVHGHAPARYKRAIGAL